MVGRCVGVLLFTSFAIEPSMVAPRLPPSVPPIELLRLETQRTGLTKKKRTTKRKEKKKRTHMME